MIKIPFLRTQIKGVMTLEQMQTKQNNRIFVCQITTQETFCIMTYDLDVVIVEIYIPSNPIRAIALFLFFCIS